MIPLLVIEGPPRQFAHAIGQVRSAGWEIHTGFHTPTPRSNTFVFTGEVADEHTAGQAVLRAVSGSGVIVHALAARHVVDLLCDDLRHVGRLDHRVGDERAVLSVEEHAILACLACGHTTTEAATQMYLSRRSIERRLNAVRKRLGVATNAALLSSYVRLIGSIPPVAGRGGNVSHFTDVPSTPRDLRLRPT